MTPRSLPHEHLNCHSQYQELRPLITEIIVTDHFSRDLPDFDTALVVDGQHEAFRHLHKFEENIEGHHVFRALQHHTHIVYCIDKQHRLIFLRAFKNFKEYKKFLDHKKELLHFIENS